MDFVHEQLLAGLAATQELAGMSHALPNTPLQTSWHTAC